ncbi:cupin domain-containing protein [Kribbella sp. NBC_01505]|uniref:cupin domain-containing protein n=1 Tax=Kribbella sp. NBC_01505 TaxID=2903580 RepID=UPI00386B1278
MSFPWSDLPHDDPAWFRRGALYVPSGTGPTVWAAGDIYTIKARADQTHGGFGLIEATVPAGGGPPPHAHPDEEETFYLLSGELEFLDGEETFLAKAGDFVHIPRGVRHRFHNIGNHAAKMLFFFTPGGVESVIADHAQPAVPGELPPATITDEQLARFATMSELARTIDLPDLS